MNHLTFYGNDDLIILLISLFCLINFKKHSLFKVLLILIISLFNLFLSNIQKLKASDIMTKNPTFVDEMILAPEALAIMNKKRITVLLVRSKGKFKGLVNIHSIIEFMNK